MNVGHDATERGDTTCRQRLTDDEDGRMEWKNGGRSPSHEGLLKVRRTTTEEEVCRESDNGTSPLPGDQHERSSLVEVIHKCRMALGEIFTRLFFET